MTFYGYIKKLTDQNFVYVDLKTPLDEVYRQLLSTYKPAAAVLENGRLKGMLCLDSISRYFMIQNALKDVRGRSHDKVRIKKRSWI
ncbi:MAG: hypothetical protein JSV50_01095 [Desulfobacteraceae bacterium]|nr:MAG: hypothetical protein JSV50_01095 [Desulfobacteraceae bacterium]